MRKCRHCLKYMDDAATDCPECGRTSQARNGQGQVSRRRNTRGRAAIAVIALLGFAVAWRAAYLAGQDSGEPTSDAAFATESAASPRPVQDPWSNFPPRGAKYEHSIPIEEKCDRFTRKCIRFVGPFQVVYPRLYFQVTVTDFDRLPPDSVRLVTFFLRQPLSRSLFRSASDFAILLDGSDPVPVNAELVLDTEGGQVATDALSATMSTDWFLRLVSARKVDVRFSRLDGEDVSYSLSPAWIDAMRDFLGRLRPEGPQ